MRKYMKALVNLAVAFAVLLFCILAVPRVLVFFMPFVIGWLIALAASPVVRFFEERLKIRRKAGSAVVIVGAIALVIVLSYLVVSRLVQEAAGFLQSLPDLWQGLETDFREIGKNMDVLYDRLPAEAQHFFTNLSLNAEDYIGGLIGSISTPTVSAVGSFAKNVPNVLIGIIMSVLAAYFFIEEKEKFSPFLRRCMPQSLWEKFSLVISSLKAAVGGYLKAQFKIEIWVYLLLVIGLMILKIEYALLIAFGIAVLDVLPFFGTGVVLWPWAVVNFLRGEYRMAVGLLIIWIVGQLVRQIIQPKIVGDSIGLAPIPTLFLIYIGYKGGGVAGMIIAIPVGIIFVNLYQAGIFDTTRDSLLLLVHGINSFRQLSTEERKSVTDTRDSEDENPEGSQQKAEDK